MKNRWAGLSLCAIGLAMLLTGILQGQPGQVMAKAIRICLECVGIG